MLRIYRGDFFKNEAKIMFISMLLFVATLMLIPFFLVCMVRRKANHADSNLLNVCRAISLYKSENSAFPDSVEQVIIFEDQFPASMLSELRNEKYLYAKISDEKAVVAYTGENGRLDMTLDSIDTLEGDGLTATGTKYIYGPFGSEDDVIYLIYLPASPRIPAHGE